MTADPHDLVPAFGLGGETPALAAATDWAATPVGAVEDWPAALRTAVGICLASRFPMMVMWGAELTMIYNDAYVPIFGEKHPQAFAGAGRDSWDEIWDTVEPMLDSVLRTGVATWSEDMPLQVRRAGFRGEAYFTFSASPIHGEGGVAVPGLYVTTVETTRQVLATRRLHTLSALARGGDVAVDAGPVAACVEAARALADNPEDVPLAALYLAGRSGAPEHLAACAGIAPESPLCPALLDPAAPPWTVTGATAAAPGGLVVRLGDATGLLLPLTGAGGTLGHLLVATSPALQLEGEYEHFFGAIAHRIGAEVGVARAIAGERDTAAALAREQTVLAEIVERAPAAICLWWGPEHRYRLVNRRYQEVVPVGDPTGRTVAEVLPDVAPIALPALDAVRTTGRAQHYDDLALPIGGEGAIEGMRYYSFAISAVPGEDGGPGGVLGVTVETTDAVRRRSELEAELLGERRIAETLQRALLPPRLPDLPGASIKARYEAAGERYQVGGDFYDAFENGDGTWTLVVGDVQGKGPRAAALTAMARYTIRAEAAHGAQPGRLVAMLNDELCRHRQHEAEFCTLVCATIALEADGTARMRVTVAGHPAPIVLRSGRGPHVIERTGPLVGIMRDASWTDVRIMLGRGDAVVFYTDGLTEARAPKVILDPVDLAAGLALETGRTADQLVSRLAAGMPSSEDLRDDYAILALSLDG